MRESVNSGTSNRSLVVVVGNQVVPATGFYSIRLDKNLTFGEYVLHFAVLEYLSIYIAKITSIGYKDAHGFV